MIFDYFCENWLFFGIFNAILVTIAIIRTNQKWFDFHMKTANSVELHNARTVSFDQECLIIVLPTLALVMGPILTGAAASVAILALIAGIHNLYQVEDKVLFPKEKGN